MQVHLDRLPGLAICIALALVAMVLEHIGTALVGEAYLEALVIAILLALRCGPHGRPAHGGMAASISPREPYSKSQRRLDQRLAVRTQITCKFMNGLRLRDCFTRQ